MIKNMIFLSLITDYVSQFSLEMQERFIRDHSTKQVF